MEVQDAQDHFSGQPPGRGRRPRIRYLVQDSCSSTYGGRWGRRRAGPDAEAGDAVRPGGEIVGTVVAAAPDVAGFEFGDRVGGVVFEDVYAENVLADPRLVSHVPAEAAAAAALALVRGGLIALSALRIGHIAPGESVLVTAGGQQYRAPGSTTGQGTRSSPGGGRRRVCKRARLRPPVRSRRGGDLLAAVLGDPVDLVLDGVGGERVQRGVNALAPFGRLVGFSAGGGTVDAGSLLARAEVGHRVLHRPGQPDPA